MIDTKGDSNGSVRLSCGCRAAALAEQLIIEDSPSDVLAGHRVIPQLHMGVPVPMSSDALRAELAIGGAVTVTLLAIWELARIRRRAAAESYPTLPVGYG